MNLATNRITLAKTWLRLGREALEEGRAKEWPDPYWADKPAEFARIILGVELWSFQLRVLDCILHARHTGVFGGRKNGKTTAVAIAALWFLYSFKDAKVVIYAPKIEKVDEILFPEIRKLYLGSGRCLECKRNDPEGTTCGHGSRELTGRLGEHAKTGIRCPDGRRLFGMAADSRGISGDRMLAIEDEACDIKDEHNHAIVGNLAGHNCKRAAVSNPTASRGWAHALAHGESALLTRDDGESSLCQVSTLENPNIVTGQNVIPGLGSRMWEREMAALFGEDSKIYGIEVLGHWPKAEEGQLFPYNWICRKEDLWNETQSTPAAGRLCVGVDVAGEGRDGDETAIAVRRNKILCPIFAARGLTTDAKVQALWRILRQWKEPEDVEDNRPRVVIDADGAEGERFYGRFRAYASANRAEMDVEVVAFHGWPRPVGKLGDMYRLNRDLLYGGFADWANGPEASWPKDLMLRAEMIEARWVSIERDIQSLIAKKDWKKLLGGRSPDRCDSLALSTWGPRQPMFAPQGTEPAPAVEARGARAARGYEWHEPQDPWAALKELQGGGRRRGGLDDDD